MKKVLIFFLILSHSTAVYTMEQESPLMLYAKEGAYKLFTVAKELSPSFYAQMPKISVVLGKVERLPIENSPLVSYNLWLQLSSEAPISLEKMVKCIFYTENNIELPENTFHMVVENCNNSKDVRAIIVEESIMPIVRINLDESDKTTFEKNPIAKVINQSTIEEIVTEPTKPLSIPAKLTGSLLLIASTLFVLHRMNFLPQSISDFLSNIQAKLFGI